MEVKLEEKQGAKCLCAIWFLSSQGALCRSKDVIPGRESGEETKVTGSLGWAEGQSWNSWKRNNGRRLFRKSFSLRQLHNYDTLGCQREPGLFQSCENYSVSMLIFLYILFLYNIFIIIITNQKETSLFSMFGFRQSQSFSSVCIYSLCVDAPSMVQCAQSTSVSWLWWCKKNSSHFFSSVSLQKAPEIIVKGSDKFRFFHFCKMNQAIGDAGIKLKIISASKFPSNMHTMSVNKYKNLLH